MTYLRWIRNQWDRSLGIAAGVVGAAALLIGAVQTSRALYPAQQIPYLVSGGLLGLFLLGVGATAWLSADLRDEWRKLDELHEAVVARGTVPQPGATAPATDGAGTPDVVRATPAEAVLR
jgi:hypothetical protein